MVKITCPACQTDFRIDPNRLKGRALLFRCARCKHRFKMVKTINRGEPTKTVKPALEKTTEPRRADFSGTPGQVYYRMALLAFIGFILIASLPPANGAYGDYSAWRFSERLDYLRILMGHDLRDIATNILLYLPLGVLAAMLAGYHHRKGLSLWLLLGPFLSLCIELVQPFVRRLSDPLDVFTNSTGFWVGYGLVYVAIRRFGLKPAGLIGFSEALSRHQKGQTLAGLRFLYGALFLVVGLLPFDLSVKLAAVYDQMLPSWEGDLRIILDPLYHLQSWPRESLKLLIEFLMVVPMGFLTALLEQLQNRKGLLTALLHCVMLVFVVELVQIFIMSRTSDVTLVLLSPIAATLGWGMAALVTRMVPQWKRSLQQKPSEDSHSTRRKQRLALLFGVGYGLFLCLMAWFPYQFELDLANVLEKIRHQSNWIPFRAHFEVRNIWSALDIVEEMILYLPMGGIAAGILLVNREIRKGPTLVAIFGGCLLMAGCIELSQAACVGRFVDISDPLLAGIGGLIGSLMSHRLFFSNIQKVGG